MENVSRERKKRRPRSPLIDNAEHPRKRRKQISVDSGIGEPPNIDSPRSEDGKKRRTKLCLAETGAMLLQDIRRQIEQVLDEEVEKLNSQAKIGPLKQLNCYPDIENIPHDPDISITSKNLRISQKLEPMTPIIQHCSKHDSKSELISRKLRYQRDIDSNSSLRESPSNTQMNKSLDCMVMIEKLNAEKFLWEERKCLLARAERADNLETELKSSREAISSLQEVVKEKTLLAQRASDLKTALERAEDREHKLRLRCQDLSFRVDKNESRNDEGFSEVSALSQEMRNQLVSENRALRDQINALVRKNAELRRESEVHRKERERRDESPDRTIKIEPIDNDYFVDVVGDGFDNFSDEIDVGGDETLIDNTDPSLVEPNSNSSFAEPQELEPVKKEKPQKTTAIKRSLTVGHTAIFPSSPDYFDIDFDVESIVTNSWTFICKTCNKKFNSRPKISDHIWAVHHRGRWLCPCCRYTSSDRYAIVQHLKKSHPNANRTL